MRVRSVRGAAGSVYHPHGVFYQDVGEDTYEVDGISYRGMCVPLQQRVCMLLPCIPSEYSHPDVRRISPCQSSHS